MPQNPQRLQFGLAWAMHHERLATTCNANHLHLHEDSSDCIQQLCTMIVFNALQLTDICSRCPPDIIPERGMPWIWEYSSQYFRSHACTSSIAESIMVTQQAEVA